MDHNETILTRSAYSMVGFRFIVSKNGKWVTVPVYMHDRILTARNKKLQSKLYKPKPTQINDK